MRSIFDSALARTVTVTDGSGTRTARAFLQPADTVRPEAPEITAAGVVDGRRWRVILPPLALTAPVTLAADGARYRLLRWETVGGHLEGVARREAAV